MTFKYINWRLKKNLRNIKSDFNNNCLLILTSNKDGCTPEYCEHDGICYADRTGSLICECTDGFMGDRCETGNLLYLYRNSLNIETNHTIDRII